MNAKVTELIRYVGRYLLDHPEQLSISCEFDNGRTIYRVSVHKDDRANLIGEGGRTAKSLRSVVRASGALSDERFQLEIED